MGPVWRMLAVVLLLGCGSLIAAIVGDTRDAIDYYEEENGGAYIIDQHVVITAPDNRVFYGPYGGSSGTPGFYSNTVVFDMPGTWKIEYYGFTEEDYEVASYYWSENVEVYEP